MTPPRPSSGFSLVETLVAMFIFVLAVGVLSQAANNAIYAISRMEITEGSEVDYQFVRDVVLTISDTDTLGMGGDVATPTAGQAHWDAETETTDTPDFFKVTLKISLAGDEAEKISADSATETMYLLRPQWSQTEDRSALLNSIHDALPNVRTQQSWP